MSHTDRWWLALEPRLKTAARLWLESNPTPPGRGQREWLYERFRPWAFRIMIGAARDMGIIPPERAKEEMEKKT